MYGVSFNFCICLFLEMVGFFTTFKRLFDQKVYILLTNLNLKMVLPDIANLVAGAYKGYMNAAGQDVDPTYLAYVLASSSTLGGLSEYFKTRRENRDPIHALASRIVSEVMGEEPKDKSPAVEGVKTGLIGVLVFLLRFLESATHIERSSIK